jgi:nucleotide sugar dehydrogenase
MKHKVGIIGLGYVGGALRHWFLKKRRPQVQLFLYDKYKKIGSVEEVNKADVVFISVPTPYNDKGGYDDSAIIESLKNLKSPKIVVIKSTIIPGSTEKFQEKFPKHKILFNPEFLRAKTANADFVKPERQIVGYTRKSKSLAKNILKLLPKAPFSKIMPATEAEMVKYFGNAFLSTKVIFANQIYDLCEKLKIDYDTIKEAVGLDKRIGTSHLDIFHFGYRGYSGGCFPKDVKAFIDFARKSGAPSRLLETADEINEKLLKSNKKRKSKKS